MELDLQNETPEKEKKPNYIHAALGAIGFIFFLWGFFEGDGNLIMRLITGIITFGGGLIITYTVLYVGLGCLSIFFNSVYRAQNSFLGGLKGAIGIFLLLGFFDMALLGGTFIYQPVMIFLFTGSFENTFWN